jgi:hypothetical protein
MKKEKNNSGKYFYLPDMITLFVSMGAIFSFFLPWIHWWFPGEIMSKYIPAYSFKTNDVTFYVQIFPYLIGVVGVLSGFFAIQRLIQKKMGFWKPKFYYVVGGFYIVSVIIWWYMVSYLPSFNWNDVFYSIESIVRTGGRVGFGMGFIILIVASGLQIVGGIIGSFPKTGIA